MRDVTILSQRDVEEMIRKLVEYRFSLIENRLDKLRLKLNDIERILETRIK